VSDDGKGARGTGAPPSTSEINSGGNTTGNQGRKASFDHCFGCGRPFEHNDGLWHGNIAGVKRDVGDCCVDRLESILAPGIYKALAKLDTADILGMAASTGMTDIIADRAGMTGLKPIVRPTTKSWQRDDRDWFRLNPRRSHRIRPAFRGEIPVPPPPGSTWIKIVRQVAPGVRTWITLFHLDGHVLPDTEEEAHQLFDSAVAAIKGAKPGERKTVMLPNSVVRPEGSA
jgi:hypothetical protein